MGDVRAQVAQRADQPRAAVVGVFDGVAVSYLAHDAPQRVALEHRFAMWVAGLAEPPGTVVFPRLPAAVRVAAVGEPPRKVVLVVDGGAVGQVSNEHRPVPVAPVAAFLAVETALGYHLAVEVALKRVAFAALVLHPGKAVVGVIAVFTGGNGAHAKSTVV